MVFGVNMKLIALCLGGRLTSGPDPHGVKSYRYVSKGELEEPREAADAHTKITSWFQMAAQTFHLTW